MIPPPTAPAILARAVCAHPNVPAATLRAAIPAMPRRAAARGISGIVRVEIALDARSRVVGASVRRSSNAIFDAAALDAARRSVFRTAVRNCRPIPGHYLFTVEFTARPPRAEFTLSPSRATFRLAVAFFAAAALLGLGRIVRRDADSPLAAVAAAFGLVALLMLMYAGWAALAVPSAVR